jgi:hypothetical protein
VSNQRVLENNLKPPTHFIEVWCGTFDKNGETINDPCFVIADMYEVLYPTSSSLILKTVAIWKIREKPNNK